MRRRECRLLPHIRKNIYGISTTSSQHYGWQIKTFDVESIWVESQGEGVTIGVIDTGCDFNHPDLKNNIIQGINIIDPSKDPMDDNGHGSHVAGTIAACNNSVGVVGVAPKTKIAPIKALDGRGAGLNTDVAKAIVWAADNGIDIVTMSLGSEYSSRQIEKAIEYAKGKNLIIFCAAGNSGIESGIQYPAKCDNTIAIGAINKDLQICEFSCSGNELDFVAPGYEIISCTPNETYSSMSGTSMATPFAVGCAALMLSYRRKKSLDSQLKDSATYIAELSKNTTHVKDSRYSGNRKYEGYGIIRPTL